MHINDLNGDLLQNFFTSTIKPSSLEGGCKSISAITRVCRNWFEIFYTRIEPIASFYNSLFIRPLKLSPQQVLSTQEETAKHLHFSFRLSIGFYFHMPSEERLYKGSQLIPLLNEDLYAVINPESENNNKNLALVLSRSDHPVLLENVLKSGIPLTRPPFINDDILSDEQIDLSIDLFWLTLKQISRSDFQDETSILSQVMQHPDFKEHQTEDFFYEFERMFFDHPSTYGAIKVWKLIEKIDLQSPMLNRLNFFSFLIRCEHLASYSQEQINEINAFIEVLLEDLEIPSEFRLESVNHSFFPAVLKRDKNRWYYYHLYLENCLERNNPIHVANARHIFNSILEDHKCHLSTIKELSYKNPFDKTLGPNYVGDIFRQSRAIAALLDDLPDFDSSEGISSDEDMMDWSGYFVVSADFEDDSSHFSDVSFTENLKSYESEDEIDIIEPPRKKSRYE